MEVGEQKSVQKAYFCRHRDHPCHPIIPFKKARDYIGAVFLLESEKHRFLNTLQISVQGRLVAPRGLLRRPRRPEMRHACWGKHTKHCDTHNKLCETLAHLPRPPCRVGLLSSATHRSRPGDTHRHNANGRISVKGRITALHGLSFPTILLITAWDSSTRRVPWAVR